MSKKRFSETEKHCYYTSLVFDNQTQEELGTPKVVVLLNMFEDDMKIKDKKIEEQQAIIDQLNFAIDDLLSHTSCEEIKKENEQLHHELQQTKEYLQTKIDECKNHEKMKEIVFGVEQAVGYEKALLQFQKGLKRRLNDE